MGSKERVMTLQRHNLDNETYGQIVEAARERIPVWCPQWTDHNIHDPGIMLMEMFAHLTEMQRFFANQSEAVAALLRLLGISLNRAAPSQACVDIAPGNSNSADPFFAPAGTPLFAEDIRFETTYPLILGNRHGSSERAMSTHPSTIVLEQCHTLSEDIDCGSNAAQLMPNTWLAAQGGSLLFYESEGRYLRIHDYQEELSADNGLPVFSIPVEKMSDEIAAGKGSFRLISCTAADAPRRVLGEAWGFPRARFLLDRDGGIVLRERFTLLVADSLDLERAQRWDMTDNLLASRPDDTHYLLNEDTGEITFGDGIHGAMPTGVVFASSLALTKGARGNITSNQLNQITFGERTLSLEQPLPSEGGRDTESAEQAIQRSQATVHRAVTAQDIEALVMGIPGLALRHAHAWRKVIDDPFAAPTVLVAVWPMGAGRPALTVSCGQRIREYLEPYRLAGTEFEITSVRYVSVDVTAEVHTELRSEAVQGVIEAAIRAFIEGRLGFGVCLDRVELILCLEALPEVQRVLSVVLNTTSGYASRDGSGSINLDESAVAVVGAVTVLFTRG
jgi:hypothetical protein